MEQVTIAGVTVDRTAALAPMAGVADTSYRALCCEMGAVMCVSEMISAKGLCYNSKGSAELCRITAAERPMGLQLYLNMGCPVPKVVNTGAGSALLKTPELAAKCVEACRKTAGVPVTVKMRIGYEKGENLAVPFAQAMENAGAAAITVHGRTKAMLYSGKADWDAIAAVKAAVKIPVIGNGDVTDGASCERMYRETGVDLVAVGRASYGNPWVFREIDTVLRGEHFTPPTPDERMAMMLRHIRMILEHSEKPPALAIREARKHASWYVTGSRHAAAFRAACYRLSSYEEAERLAEEYLAANA